jgi:hypothetical protein
LSAAEAAEPSDFARKEVSRILREIRELGWHNVSTDKTISVHDLDAHLEASRDEGTIIRKNALKVRMAHAGMLP